MSIAKYNIAASKLIGDKQMYTDLKKGISYFDLSMWNDEKVEEQMMIEFACRKKEMVKGLYKCNKCGGDEVYTQSIQMRSGDEATSNFAMCANSECKSRPWEI